jgi:hypothetical protein
MAAAAGAFIRSCSNGGIPAEFAHAWCGKPLEFAATSHQHCAGCALMLTGLALVAVSPFLMSQQSRRSAARASQ